MQIPAYLKRNKGPNSSFYAYFESYQGIRFSLFTVHFFFSNLQSYNRTRDGKGKTYPSEGHLPWKFVTVQLTISSNITTDSLTAMINVLFPKKN